MQIFKIKSSWESDYYKKNIIFKNQKPRKMEFLPIHRRKSKSCETKFNLDEFLTPVVIKSINDLTVRKSDLEKQNPNINFLNSIDNVTSKIKQFSIESKLVPKENFISTDRINKQKNLLALFAPNTSYRTDLMIKMEEMKNKQLDKHKKRVKTLSGYNNVRRDIPENRTMDKKINEEYKENIISVILYKTLKCDKIIPNEKKIKISLQFFDKIKKDLQKKADEKCVRNTKVKETNIQIGPFYPKTKKELSKEGNDCDLFNFIGNINN